MLSSFGDSVGNKKPASLPTEHLWDSESKKLLHLLETTRETEDSWNSIDQTLSRLDSLCQSGVYKYSSFSSVIKKLKEPLVNSLLSERTKLSGTAINLVVTIASLPDNEVVQLSDWLLPALLRLCLKTNRVVVSRANNCLQVMFKNNSCLTKKIPKLCQSLSNPNKTLRLTLVSLIGVIMAEHSVSDYHDYKDQLGQFIVSALEDASLEVREGARKLYHLYENRFPEDSIALRDKMNPNTQKYLKFNSNNSSNVRKPFAERTNQTALAAPTSPVVQRLSALHVESTKKGIASLLPSLRKKDLSAVLSSSDHLVTASSKDSESTPVKNVPSRAASDKRKSPVTKKQSLPDKTTKTFTVSAEIKSIITTEQSSSMDSGSGKTGKPKSLLRGLGGKAARVERIPTGNSEALAASIAIKRKGSANSSSSTLFGSTFSAGVKPTKQRKVVPPSPAKVNPTPNTEDINDSDWNVRFKFFNAFAIDEECKEDSTVALLIKGLKDTHFRVVQESLSVLISYLKTDTCLSHDSVDLILPCLFAIKTNTLFKSKIVILSSCENACQLIRESASGNWLRHLLHSFSQSYIHNPKCKSSIMESIANEVEQRVSKDICVLDDLKAVIGQFECFFVGNEKFADALMENSFKRILVAFSRDGNDFVVDHLHNHADKIYLNKFKEITGEPLELTLKHVTQSPVNETDVVELITCIEESTNDLSLNDLKIDEVDETSCKVKEVYKNDSSLNDLMIEKVDETIPEVESIDVVDDIALKVSVRALESARTDLEIESHVSNFIDGIIEEIESEKEAVNDPDSSIVLVDEKIDLFSPQQARIRESFLDQEMAELLDGLCMRTPVTRRFAKDFHVDESSFTASPSLLSPAVKATKTMTCDETLNETLVAQQLVDSIIADAINSYNINQGLEGTVNSFLARLVDSIDI